MLSLLLFPFAWLYGVITQCRNLLYDIGWKKSHSFDQALVVVGNLSVGGTGKTPMIEYLVNLLVDHYSVAILSRGYGRDTHGFLQAERHDDSSTLGDEPFQFYRKFGKKLTVVVCESRVEGITKLLNKKPDVQIILLDDAFQHRAVKPLLSILLSDFSKPFFKDHLLPMGRLRESRSGSKRANILVATKCSSLTKETEVEFSGASKRFAGNKPVFFSGIRYHEPVPFEGGNKIEKNIILVTGIANSKPIEDYVSSRFALVYHFRFNDHHQYSIDDIEAIQRKVINPTISILTTEKDMVKIISPSLSNGLNKKLWFYLPIESYFLNSGAEFDKLVMEKIKTKLNPSKT